MTIKLSEMTREQIGRIAPDTLAVFSTASIEQHGPHLPVCTDSLLCETVTLRAVERAAEQIKVVAVPILFYGNSHHHYPFPGTLSLSSPTYISAVTEVLEGLVRSGFQKLVVLNGHGGNTESNGVVGLDFVHRLNQPVSIATAAYWDIARARLVEQGLVPGGRIPGHAGYFETAMVMAIRPDLVTPEALAQAPDVSKGKQGLFAPFAGATVQRHGVWAAGPGYTDDPPSATAEQGQAILEVVVQAVADFLVAFYQS